MLRMLIHIIELLNIIHRIVHFSFLFSSFKNNIEPVYFHDATPYVDAFIQRHRWELM